jgi:hypothetical protein
VLTETETTRFFDLHVRPDQERTYRQERPGKVGPHTRFRSNTRERFTLTWRIRPHVVKADAASDGCFPLVTNDPDISPGSALAAYKYQPNLERRHAQLKGPQAVAPVFLKHPARIEALLCCHFLALLVQALIERQIRTAMADRRRKPSRSTPKTATAPLPQRPEPSRSSTVSAATTSTATGPSSKSSTPTSPPSNTKSSDSSASPPPSTNDEHRRQITRQKCGKRVSYLRR